MPKSRGLLACGLLLVYICGASAWFHSGHMAVGFKAWQNISANNRAKINRLLKVFENDKTFGRGEGFLRDHFNGEQAALARFLYATTWMDDVKEGMKAEIDNRDETDVTMPYFPVEVRGDPMDSESLVFILLDPSEMPPGRHPDRRYGNHFMDKWHFNEARYFVVSPYHQHEVKFKPFVGKPRLVEGIRIAVDCILNSKNCPKLKKQEGMERSIIDDLPLVKSICLRLLLHMVGDLVMPLHLMSLEYTHRRFKGNDRGGTMSCTGEWLPFTASVINRDGTVRENQRKSLPNLHLTLDATAGLLPYTEFDQKRLSVKQTETLMEVFAKKINSDELSCDWYDVDAGLENFVGKRRFMDIAMTARRKVDLLMHNNLRMGPPQAGQKWCVASITPLATSTPDIHQKQAEIEGIIKEISGKEICFGGEYLGRLLDFIMDDMVDADEIPAQGVNPISDVDILRDGGSVEDAQGGILDNRDDDAEEGKRKDEKVEERVVDRIESEGPVDPDADESDSTIPDERAHGDVLHVAQEDDSGVVSEPPPFPAAKNEPVSPKLGDVPVDDVHVDADGPSNDADLPAAKNEPVSPKLDDVHVDDVHVEADGPSTDFQPKTPDTPRSEFASPDDIDGRADDPSAIDRPVIEPSADVNAGYLREHSGDKDFASFPDDGSDGEDSNDDGSTNEVVTMEPDVPDGPHLRRSRSEVTGILRKIAAEEETDKVTPREQHKSPEEVTRILREIANEENGRKQEVED